MTGTAPIARRLICALLAGLLLSAAFPASSYALGPENVLLVVNPQSSASLAVANHFQYLRGIPPERVFYLPYDPQRELIDVDTFREEILRPVLREADRVNRQGRIDCVVYSAGYPWGVELNKDIERYLARQEEAAENAPGNESGGGDDEKPAWPKPLSRRGSLNGLTYLYQGVLAENPAFYMSLRANQYMRRAIPQQADEPTLGFRSDLRFGVHGELVGDGVAYLPAMVLGIPADEDTRGNTLDEIIAYLKRSAAADGTRPEGAVYYVRNGDVRSRTRQSAFPEAVEQLEKLGVRGAIVFGRVPEERPDCIGVMMGTASFDWSESGSTILPGAICDHLTSCGGIMRRGAPQTPLTEFLAHGAAAASGTVIEPFAIQEKFPFPMIHVHYARGCTAVEAFYQSVYGPYQLLIVGDPLCRPWANIPEVSVEGLEAGQTVTGPMTVTPRAKLPGGRSAGQIEVYVDSRLVERCEEGESVVVDTGSLGDGWHRLRATAIVDDQIATSGSVTVPFVCNNRGRRVEQQISPRARVDCHDSIRFRVSCPGAIGLAVRQNTRVLGRCVGEEGDILVEAEQLGAGPVHLQVVALGSGGRSDNVYGQPVFFDVTDTSQTDRR